MKPDLRTVSSCTTITDNGYRVPAILMWRSDEADRVTITERSSEPELYGAKVATILLAAIANAPEATVDGRRMKSFRSGDSEVAVPSNDLALLLRLIDAPTAPRHTVPCH